MTEFGRIRIPKIPRPRVRVIRGAGGDHVAVASLGGRHAVKLVVGGYIYRGSGSNLASILNNLKSKVPDRHYNRAMRVLSKFKGVEK